MSKSSAPVQPAPVLTPAVELDLEIASTRAFDDAVTKFYQWSESQPEFGPLEFENGWYDVTWIEAQDWLRRNVQNREPSLSHVKKLHYDMARGNWRRTGQGLVFNEEGKLNEGQQRLLACYFGKVGFRTYIVTDAPNEPDLFAFYDDMRPRSAADALQTSGSNGIANHLAAAVHISDRLEREAIGILRQPKIHRLNPREVLAYSRENPSLAEAAHIIFGNYAKAVGVIEHKGVAIVFAERIIRFYGLNALDGFFNSLGSGANLDEDDPILGLRNRLLRGKEDSINKERILALLIKAFNYHQARKKLTRGGLFVKDNDKFPKFETVGDGSAEE